MNPPPTPSRSTPATVIHLITQLELGGAQENTLYTCKNLDPAKYRVVLGYGPGGMLTPEAEQISHIQTLELAPLVREIRPKEDARALRLLYQQFRTLRRDHLLSGGDPKKIIVHTHSSKAGILGRMAAKAAGIPNIVHSIHGFSFYEGQDPRTYQLFINAERAAGRITHGFISVSKTNLEEAKRRRIIPRGIATKVIRSGMPLKDYIFIPPRGEARRALNYPFDAEIVLCIANFKPQKDPFTLIEAFRELAERRPKTMLLVAGDGPLRADIELRIRAYQLTTKVHLLGWRRDIPRLLAATDIVVLSSIFEGLPRVAVQAVAARRPFVGTHVDGTPEIIRDGKNGFLVPPQAPSLLAQALERGLIERPLDPEDPSRILAWDADNMVRQQELFYDALLTEHTTKPSPYGLDTIER